VSCTAGGQTCLFPPEETPDPLLCWLWLAHTMGPASSHAGRVLDVFGGPQEAWEARHSGAFRQAAGAAAAQRAAQPDNTPEAQRPVVLRCQKRGVRILPFDDPDYPLALARIPDMPLVLYCTGDTAWLNQPGAVGMVGSRRPTEYGLQAAEILGRGLAQGGAVIVSGLADGLDSASHRAAVSAGCPTIGVLGVPIDRTYPAANTGLRRSIEQCGCVISEYAPGEESVGRYGFLQRNRLIAALGSALVVMEAREKAAPCPPWPMQNGMGSRCLRCRAASFRPIQRARTGCCNPDGPRRYAPPQIFWRHWAFCRGTRRRRPRLRQNQWGRPSAGCCPVSGRNPAAWRSWPCAAACPRRCCWAA